MEYLCCYHWSKCWGYQDKEPAKCKLAVVGDPGCGKTSLIFRFSRGKMPEEDENVPSCLDTDYLELQRNGKTIYLAVHDTSGTEEDARVRGLTYNGCDVVIICFPLDSQEALHKVVSDWAAEVRHLCPRKPYLLVGTKQDLRNKSGLNAQDKLTTLVSEKMGKKTAKTIGASAYFECSALEDWDGKSAKRIFGRAVRETF